MDERWQRELTKLRNAPSPSDDLWGRIEDGSRLPDPGVSRTNRAVTIAVALVVTIGAIAILWIALRPLRGDERTPGSLGLLDVPPTGQVAPANLDDGRPVFVVHREDGTVAVIDAYSTHVPYGLAKLVAWCPSSRSFDDVFHGSRWNEDGAYLMGPGPTGLVTYQTTPEHDDRVLVGPAIPGTPRDTPHGLRTSGPYCTTAASYVLPTLATPVSDSPAGTVAGTPSGWVAVRGTLVWTSTGAELCAGREQDATCSDGATVRGLDTNDIPPARPVVIAGTFIARVEGGTLVDLTRVPTLPFDPF